MDVATILMPFINEAVRAFGPWAAVPGALGFAAYEARRRLNAKDEEILRLRHLIHDLQDKRLHDAREMTRIAESGAAATAARTDSDRRFADLIEALLARQSGGVLGWRR